MFSIQPILTGALWKSCSTYMTIFMLNFPTQDSSFLLMYKKLNACKLTSLD